MATKHALPPDIFEPLEDEPKGGVRNTDPDTSRQAAETVPVSKLEQMFIHALAVNKHPMTTTEIANFYGMDRDSFSPRPPRLIKRGLIERDGKRLCANSAGKIRDMIAFRLKEKAGYS